MSLIKIISRFFKAVAYIIGILALYFMLEERTWIIAITLMLLMYFILFIFDRLEMCEISKNCAWRLYQRRSD